MPTQPSRCHSRTLARSSVVHIEQCGECAVLSLHFGALTLRLEAAAAEALYTTLSDALRARAPRPTTRQIGLA